MHLISDILLGSISYGLDHREEAVKYALQFGRGLDLELADRFVGLYVNQWTLNYGPAGRKAISEFVNQGGKAGLIPKIEKFDFI